MAALQEVSHVDELLELPQFRNDLIAASGFSEKAKNRIAVTELDEAVIIALRKIASDAGTNFRQELVYRFLLTQGDALGGQMRNWTGANAGRKFTTAIHEAFSSGPVPRVHYRPGSNEIQALEWDHRLLVFNRTVKFLGKNVDVILLETPTSPILTRDLLEIPQFFIACGELKGGIDPAGADEHWKTAVSALERIRVAFGPSRFPSLFFVGGAIEASMAIEIYAELTSGRLAYAANLTVPDQMVALAAWLVSL
jgi:type II restriction enzyme